MPATPGTTRCSFSTTMSASSSSTVKAPATILRRFGSISRSNCRWHVNTVASQARNSPGPMERTLFGCASRTIGKFELEDGMQNWIYACPPGGHPPQTDLLTGRAVFTEAYAVIPKGVMRDIVCSVLPFWEKTKVWILARPVSGFTETFSQYIMEIAPGGGSEQPEPDPGAEGVLFVTSGEISLTLAGTGHRLTAGGYAYIPTATVWVLHNRSAEPATFHWIRKSYDAVPGVRSPDAFVTNETEITPCPMPGTDGRWATTRFVDPEDVRHDMHVNIV